MKITKIWAVTFSPTRTSKKSVEALASGITGVPYETIDLTYPGKTHHQEFGPDELVIFGVPVYAGRVAPLAVQRLATLKGNNTPAVISVTYGNRAYEDALVELRDLARQASFKPIGACAFIGEHSYSGADTPIAPGRPDSADLSAAASFGSHIGAKLAALATPDDTACPEIPGNVPYRDGVGPMPCIPTLLEDACTQCGTCVDSCPSGAVSLQERIIIHKSSCILCCACVKNCPEEALIIDFEPLNQRRRAMAEQLAQRREPELYL